MAFPTSFQEFSDLYLDDIETLAVLGAGVLGYALVANWFYQVISKRVMFGTVGADGAARVGGPGRGFVYLMMFPLLSLAYFLLLSAALLFLGPEDQQPIEVFTLAMAIILAVRVAAYFSEATSHDLAKMLPLALLGVVLVTRETGGLSDSFQKMLEMFEALDIILVYFIIVVIAEYVLRSIYLLRQAANDSKRRRRGGGGPARPRPTMAPSQRTQPVAPGKK